MVVIINFSNKKAPVERHYKSQTDFSYNCFTETEVITHPQAIFPH